MANKLTLTPLSTGCSLWRREVFDSLRNFAHPPWDEVSSGRRLSRSSRLPCLAQSNAAFGPSAQVLVCVFRERSHCPSLRGMVPNQIVELRQQEQHTMFGRDCLGCALSSRQSLCCLFSQLHESCHLPFEGWQVVTKPIRIQQRQQKPLCTQLRPHLGLIFQHGPGHLDQCVMHGGFQLAWVHVHRCAFLALGWVCVHALQFLVQPRWPYFKFQRGFSK